MTIPLKRKLNEAINLILMTGNAIYAVILTLLEERNVTGVKKIKLNVWSHLIKIRNEIMNSHIYQNKILFLLFAFILCIMRGKDCSFFKLIFYL